MSDPGKKATGADGLIKRIRRSIFTKLLIVMLAAGMMIIFIAASFYKLVISNQGQAAAQQNIIRYLDYIIEDLGSPPDTMRAIELSLELGIDIRFESEKLTWATSDKILAIQEYRERHWHHDRNTGWYHGRFFMVRPTGQGQYLFITDFQDFMEVKSGWLLCMILLMTLVLVAAYLIIRQILKPIFWLTEGMTHISRGELDHRIPVRKSDELGALSTSFNSMSAQIADMLHARERLLLDVSHELRSPLTRMRVALEFLPEDDRKVGLLEDLQGMEKMIAEILESARLDSKYGGLKRMPTNLASLCRDIVALYGDTPPGIDLSQLPELVEASIDPERTGIVLKNLLENALKYSTGQSLPVQLRIDSSSESIILSIEDSGIGIPEEDLPHLFEPFYRVDKSRSQHSGGYGLGMSICKLIMDAHGGDISIASKVGKGSIVTLKFSTG